MLDIKLIRENPEKVRDGIRRKGMNEAVLDELLVLDEERRVVRQETEQKEAERNQASLKMKTATPEEREAAREGLRALGEEISAGNTRLAEMDSKYLELMYQIPNMPTDDVPVGKSDKENVVVRQEGEKHQFTFTPKDHEELCRDLDLLDTERAGKVSGSKFYYLKNELAILELAALRWCLDRMVAKGFIPMTVPNLVKADVLYGAGHFSSPNDPVEGDAYAITRDNLFLVGTAEPSLVAYHMNEILHESELSLRYVGISPAYRREARTYGKETRGLYRVHQFNKVEMVVFARPEDSVKEHELMLALSEELLKELDIPYQVVLNCGGDLGLPQAKKWDLEAWMPGMGKYGETHSCSNDTDYQARNLNIRYKHSGDGGEKQIDFVHTLNNTVLASPRILIPILENYQREDGSIEIPAVLQPYTRFTEIRKK